MNKLNMFGAPNMLHNLQMFFGVFGAQPYSEEVLRLDNFSVYVRSLKNLGCPRCEGRRSY